MNTFTYEERETFYACLVYAADRGYHFHADERKLELVIFQELTEIDRFELANPVYNITIH